MNIDFTKFEGSLPYASEMFGVYQPLLGWKSRRVKLRFQRVTHTFRQELISYISSKIFPDVKVNLSDRKVPVLEQFNIGTLVLAQRSGVSTQIDGPVACAVLNHIQKSGANPADDTIWRKVLGIEALTEIMKEVQTTIQNNPSQILAANRTVPGNTLATTEDLMAQIQRFANHESVVAGTLHYLAENKMFPVLRELFSPTLANLDLSAFFDMKAFVNPLEHFDPKSDINLVALSPVAIVHLFRQYFFEFDTFLGTPVQHIWLSPGGTVELIEINTRKTITERFTESAFESVIKTEKPLTETDELSEAIRSENQSDTKLGVSVTASGGINLGIFTANASASMNYGFNTNEKTARETLHKRTRQQSSKLATEIKKNFKSSFKTTVEVQDTTSKRYVLQNTSNQLVNYELRRKMRQVGVQIQDIGTYLCWQTYVDTPGDALGVAKLVHIAEPADLTNLKQPEAPTFLQPQVVDVAVSFPYKRIGELNEDEDDAKHITYYHGEDDSGDNHIENTWYYHADPPDHGYTLDKNITVAPLHSSTCVAKAELIDPKNPTRGDYDIYLSQVNFDGQPQINIKVTLRWNPPDQSAILDKFKVDQNKYTREKERLTKEAYIKAARDRIKVASNIEPRDSMEMREEERIVVYRKLIGQLLNVGVNLENNKTRHIMAELISSMFDIDKMLYFVAPEWWRPKLHESHQTFGSATADGTTSSTTLITEDNMVSWGGANEWWREDNYWITEDSKPAKLGSSLGWLLQLDGDNMRNAFLNAPWVKAVIPIRPGKERAALNWLTHASVEGTDGLDAKYQAASADEAKTIADTLKTHTWTDADDKARYGATLGPTDITVRDALNYLAIYVADKNQQSNVVQQETLGGKMESYLPTDLVYEHGFYPLQGGFKAASTKPFEVFDQWVEILPTDQIVAVEVTYDPKTGMQV